MASNLDHCQLRLEVPLMYALIFKPWITDISNFGTNAIIGFNLLEVEIFKFSLVVEPKLLFFESKFENFYPQQIECYKGICVKI